jgi:hypothetical protein
MHNLKSFWIIVIHLCLGLNVAIGQSKPVKEAKGAFLIGASMAYQVPDGDWSTIFNDQFAIGAEFGYKTASNWTLSAEWMYGFGTQVNEPQSILAPVATSDGLIVNLNGGNAQVNLMQRNTYYSINLEKNLGFWQANPNSGPVLSVGAGYLWHWIRIDNVGNDSPQIVDDYRLGYDQLSHGFLTRQSLGYLFMSPNRRINFKLSFELLQSFTESVRGYNYATAQIQSGQNTNWFYGLKLNWYIPIYRDGSNSEYYY